MDRRADDARKVWWRFLKVVLEKARQSCSADLARKFVDDDDDDVKSSTTPLHLMANIIINWGLATIQRTCLLVIKRATVAEFFPQGTLVQRDPCPIRDIFPLEHLISSSHSIQ